MGDKVKSITLTFNKETLEDYTKNYFQTYRSRRKPPLDWTGKKRNGQLVSWNRFINSPNRIMQNQWKQEFADYTKFILESNNIEKLMIKRCVIFVKQFQQTRTSSDSDNIMCKASLDAMVKYGLLEEDNYKVVDPVVLVSNYDKLNPRTEFTIYILENDNDLALAMEEISKEVVKIKCK